MATDYQSPKFDPLFDAFGHAKRRGMIYSLAFRPATVSQLANEFDLSLPAIHKHIRVLETAMLIDRKKTGRTNFISLNTETLKQVQLWFGQFRTEWGSDKQTLDNYLAGMEDSF